MNTVDRKGVKIRPMVSSDIPHTLDIWWADIPRKETLAQHLGEHVNLSLIAEYDGLLVGLILAGIMHAGLPMTGTGVIYFVAVKPDYQGNGIGTMLIDALKKNYKDKGIPTVRALIPRGDAKISKYFEKAGFHPSNIINFDCPT